MDKLETLACLRVLLAVARADGTVDDDEMRTLSVIAGGDAPRERAAAIDVDRELAKLRSPEARALTLRAALALANVDGRCSAEEHALLARIHDALADDAAPDLADAEAAWAARMRDVRDEAMRASDDFLHKFAAEASSLSQRDYEALVRDLETKKRDLLRDALAAPA